jgi:hypothetical protein
MNDLVKNDGRLSTSHFRKEYMVTYVLDITNVNE